MSGERDALAARIRRMLPAGFREVKMFGGLSFMIDERLVVAAGKQGDLLVHVDPARNEALLNRPGARGAEMGKGRSMGPAWIEVARASLDDAALTYWIGKALTFNRPG